MTLSYAPDPRHWIEVPAEPDDGWARAAAERLAGAHGVHDEQQIAWLAMLAAQAAGPEPGDENARWLCVTDLALGAMVLDLDWVELGADVPDEIDVAEAASGRTEEFVAGRTHGKRIIWVTPADAGAIVHPGADNGALQGQLLYVARVGGTNLLVTMRSNQHSLDLVVASIARCEEMLATIQGCRPKA